MKLRILLLSACLFFASMSYAQNVGIGTTTPGAKLEVSSTNSGMLIPRVALTGSNDVTTVPSPANSTLIFNTATVTGAHAITPGFYWWNGSLSSWTKVLDNASTPGDTNIYNTDGTLTGNRTMTMGGHALNLNGGTLSTNQDASINGMTVGLGAGSQPGNTAIGSSALHTNNTGNYNTATGFQSMLNNTSGANNTANGYGALTANSSGSSNTAAGYDALWANTTGGSNSAVGYGALGANTTGYYNTGIGGYAITANTTGGSNTGQGFAVMYKLTSGSNNTGNGFQALYSNLSGNNNLASGYQAGYNGTGSGNVMLGYQAGYNETGSNKLYISNSSTSTPLMYGDFTNQHLTVNDSLTTQYFQMTNGGTANYLLQSDASGNGTWVSPSTIAAQNIYNTDGTLTGNRTMTMGTDSITFSSTNGSFRYATTNGNIEMGNGVSASGGNSMATGFKTVASGNYGTALGFFNFALGNYSTALGADDSAVGNGSFVEGYAVNARSFQEIALGASNTNYTPASTTAWNTSDRLFGVGNGANPGSRSDAMVILKSGNVGIGTSTPNATLAVVGKGIFGDNTVTNNDANDNIYLERVGSYTQMHLYNNDGSNTDINAYVSENTTGNSSGFGNTTPGFNIWTASAHPIRLATNGAQRMVILSTGNVGINVTAPSSTLQVGGTTTTTNFQMTNGGTANYLLVSDASGNGTWTNPSTIAAENIYNTDGTLTGARTVTMGGNTINFTGGNVGIGTASPGTKLQVAGGGIQDLIVGNTGNSQQILIGNGSGYSGLSAILQGTGYNTLALNGPGSGGVSIGNTAAGSNLLYVNSTAANGYGITLNAEAGTSTSNGGSISLNAGNGNAATSPSAGEGGGINLIAGQGATSGSYGTTGGSVTIAANGSSYCAGCGLGAGSVNIYSGGPISGSSLTTGNINFYTNYATPTQVMSIVGSNSSVLFKGNNTNAAAASVSAVEFQTGRTNASALVGGQSNADIAIQYGGGGYRHFIATRHNSVAGSNQNAIDFYLNNSATSGGSSAPGTGNVEMMSITATGVGIGTASPGATLAVNGTTQLGSPGTLIKSMQMGQITLGTCSSGSCKWTLTFPNTFANTPKVIATVQTMTGQTYSDNFSVTVQSLSTTSVVFVIQRTDTNAAWGQTPLLNWMAWDN